ncbi:MAG: adenylate/guanylate cyclase domain-containing protein [Cyclobacteriaceae bacterium]|nr:adenylate/guanylate cyclase domain-containing protein [Cyclobacteriaceae bacterium]
MKSFFHQRFEEQFLNSERLRTRILLISFSIGSLYAIINFFILSGEASSELRNVMRSAMLFLLCMTIFECATFYLINREISKGSGKIPVAYSYINAFIEISSPTLIMLIVAANVSTPAIVLQSPIVYFYFVFIILSTLRLDFRLSVFITLIASIEYLLLSLYLIGYHSPGAIDQLQNSFVSILGKSLATFMCGMGAAFVSREIRKEIDRSLAFAQKGSEVVNMFGQQISREIVDQMLEEKGSIPSKKMRVCIMFIDIRNFTSYVVGKTPSEIVAYQNMFFSVVVDVVTKHHGIINQFLGDGCMVTFGAPMAVSNPGKSAVIASLEILEQLSQKHKNGEIPLIGVGMGIHVGEVVTGNIGTSVRQQYSITGTPVILAARLEQLNKEYQSQILVSSQVMEEIDQSQYKSENLGSVMVKGWSEKVEVYKLA